MSNLPELMERLEKVERYNSWPELDSYGLPSCDLVKAADYDAFLEALRVSTLREGELRELVNKYRDKHSFTCQKYSTYDSRCDACRDYDSIAPTVAPVEEA